MTGFGNQFRSLLAAAHLNSNLNHTALTNIANSPLPSIRRHNIRSTLLLFSIVAALSTAIPQPTSTVINQSSQNILIKPEIDSQSLVILKPGDSYSAPIDGIAYMLNGQPYKPCANEF